MTDDVCDWWELRPKLGQVCDITNIHKLCRALGLLTTYAQGGSQQKTALCARCVNLEAVMELFLIVLLTIAGTGIAFFLFVIEPRRKIYDYDPRDLR